jgi:hypothetical protein
MYGILEGILRMLKFQIKNIQFHLGTFQGSSSIPRSRAGFQLLVACGITITISGIQILKFYCQPDLETEILPAVSSTKNTRQLVLGYWTLKPWG